MSSEKDYPQDRDKKLRNKPAQNAPGSLTNTPQKSAGDYGDAPPSGETPPSRDQSSS